MQLESVSTTTTYKRAGYLALVEIPEVGGLFAVLQRRGDWTIEGGIIRKASFAGGCQVTAIGKCDGLLEAEYPGITRLREVAEELGPDVRDLIHYTSDRIEVGEGETSIVAEKIYDRFLHAIRLHPGSGGLVLLPRSKFGNVIELKRHHKDDGVKQPGVIAMFPDELRAVQRAFEHFS